MIIYYRKSKYKVSHKKIWLQHQDRVVFLHLIELDVAVDLAHKEVAASVANSTSHNKEDNRHH